MGGHLRGLPSPLHDSPSLFLTGTPGCCLEMDANVNGSCTSRVQQTQRAPPPSIPPLIGSVLSEYQPLARRDFFIPANEGESRREAPLRKFRS